jgi:hypothetical protein
MDAAKTNLRLAKELNKGELPLSRALWVLGAHHVAIRELAPAKEFFSDAAKHAAKANAKADELLCIGYLHLTSLVVGPDDVAAKTALQRTKEELSAVKDGKEFMQQLEVALSVFQRAERDRDSDTTRSRRRM